MLDTWNPIHKYGTCHAIHIEQVVYTQDRDIQIHVHAEVIDPDMGSQSTSNNFHFTFRCYEPKIPEIMPRSYAGMVKRNLTGICCFVECYAFVRPVLV